ncbi:type VI secretion system-associated FHA domain protein TagH [Methylomonas sp. MO1]|uniref:type VI secretion system-associated FHA domain protein TagH n=1 Tax=unclassified Methylomonas TaxID=2608980 RepID=UPI0018CC2DEF|nr:MULTISPECIES: type VI secretion system-associated FHA domain protein TagH [unclassified Methylomonas]MDT4289882.1 type VI secretion system-associated FHA domain protein TagH [Methylomonas sp. MO1]
MPIILKVLSYKGLPLPAELSAEFGQLGGTIGRKAGNTLVLPDAENFVSGHHAEIIYEDGGYLIKDTSKNGTYLSNAGLNINDTQARLLDREILRIGEYEIIVELSSGEISPVSPISIESLSPSPFAESFQNDQQSIVNEPLNFSIPHNAASSPFGERPPASPFHDHFAAPEVLSPESDGKDIAEFLKGLDSLGALDTPFTAPPKLEFPNSEAINLSEPSSSNIALDSKDLFQNTSNIEREDEPKAPQADVGIALTPNKEPYISPKSGDAALMKMFLDGAGIKDQSFLTEEQWPEAMKASGVLFRNLIEGLMDVLRARAEMKSEFRVSVTTIRSFDNNPLKFNPDVESVLKLMLAPNNPAFINSNDAVTEAFKDVKFHQLAMTAGIQAALGEILHRFDPDTFEKVLGEGIVFQRKAKCWELFCEKYPELKTQAIEGFFGEEFAEAYEKQMRLFARR